MKTESPEAGFSLLEILVAFAVLALTLGVLLRIFGGGTRTAATVDEYTRAITLGESLLSTVGVTIPLQPGETEGDLDEQYHWRLQVSPYPVSPELLALDAAVPPPVQPWWLELSIEWGEADTRRHFHLQTLRTRRTETPSRSSQPRVPFRG